MTTQPKAQFRGWWIPRDIVEEFQSGNINSKHLILLATIDSFCAKRGCFASNEYLAELVKVKERRLIQMIAELVELGLLTRFQSEENGRELFTIWSKQRRKILHPGGAKSCTRGVQEIAPLQPMKLADAISTDYKGDARAARVGFVADVPFEKKWAYRLRDAITAQFNITKDAKTWPRILTHMQRFGGVSQERIKLAIKWYELHAGDLFAPHIEDAQAFRNKFAALEKQMKVAETPKARTVQISDDAQKIVDTMKANDGFAWPKGSGRDVPELVQASLDAFAAYQARRKAIVATWRDESLLFYDQHINGHLGPGERFVLRWVRRVHASIENWEEWRGQLSYFHWSLTHPNFRKMILESIPDIRERDVDEYLRRIAA